MPIKANAKKALRQAQKRELANKEVKKAYKDAVKAVKKALAQGSDTANLIKIAQKKLDKAAKKGVIKQNTASRKFSRLMKMINTRKKA